MPLLDLLGTFAGAAFLAGSVTLAVVIDRREAEKAKRLSWASESPGAPGVPAGASRLRLVPESER